MWESIGNGSKVSSVGVRLRKMQTSFPQQCLWWQKNQGPEFFSWLWPSVGRLVGLPDSSAGKESTCNAGDRREKEKRVQSLGQEDPLGEEMATHSIILAWKIPWTEEPGGLQSMGSQRVGHDWATEPTHMHTHTHTHTHTHACTHTPLDLILLEFKEKATKNPLFYTSHCACPLGLLLLCSFHLPSI